MIRTGLDSFLENLEKYKNRGIALIANQTSVSRDLEYSWDIFIRKGLNLKKIFSPEHGLFGTEQDQVPVKAQPGINCEVVSLYGDSHESLLPLTEMLDGIDLVIFDIQDVGSRYYTFVNTMAMFMQAISGMDIEFMVLDRPNPLGGILTEGPVLKEAYESFVGVFDISVRHGLTPAELAMYFMDSRKPDLGLSVEKMRGWKRNMLFEDTGLAWIPPSPNMPSVKTAAVYPGLCLLEGTNISEGRGTTTPFEMTGAPYIDAENFCKVLNSYRLPGVFFRPVYFKPVFNKYGGTSIGGAYIHITNIDVFTPFLAGITIVKTAFDLYGGNFEFLNNVYEFNTKHPAFDLLTGGPGIREMILDHKSIEEIRDFYRKDEEDYAEIKNRFHIY